MSTNREIAERIAQATTFDHIYPAGTILGRRALADAIEAALTAATEAGKAEARREANEACELVALRIRDRDEEYHGACWSLGNDIAEAIRSRISVQQDAGKE